MTARRYAIPSLLAAGLVSPPSDAATPPDGVTNTEPDAAIARRLMLDHKYYLAAHRSHQSHGSHRSHRSSSGGGYTVPRSNSTPPSSVLPSAPRSAPSTLPGNSAKFKEIVMQVQLALQAFGYYSGTIDGVIGSQSKAALMSFQKDYGLSVTGTITPEVLNAFGIQAQ